MYESSNCLEDEFIELYNKSIPVISLDDIFEQDNFENQLIVNVRHDLFPQIQALMDYNELIRQYNSSQIFKTLHNSPFGMPINSDSQFLTQHSQDKSILVLGCYLGQKCCVNAQIKYLIQQGLSKQLSIVSDLTYTQCDEQIAELLDLKDKYQV